MMQAKDIATADVLAVIDRLCAKPLGSGAALLGDIQDAMPDVPPRVVLAKLRGMVKRGLLTGCDCGCRGDFRRAS